MSKSLSIRLSLVAGVGLGAVGVVLCLLLLIPPPAQAQSPSPAYYETISSFSSERLDGLHAADAPAVLPGPADYPPCDFYVSDEESSSDGYGCTFDNRCRSLQRAIEAALDPGDVICVSGGNYAWSKVNNRGDDGLVDVEKSVVLLGGWNYAFDTRDPTLYPSVLGAERQERVLYVNGFLTVTIDGFEIISGYRETTGGSGIYVRYAETTIANCLIANNLLSRTVGLLDGAGIFFNIAPGSRVLSSTLRDNVTNGRGGGIYGTSSDGLVLQNLTVISNVAQSGGGGIYLPSCHTPTLRSALIANNQTDGNRGGLYIKGNRPTLDHVVLDNNTAGDAHGGFYLEGLTATLSYVTVTNNVVITGGNAGGGYIESDYASLSNMLVQNNHNTNALGDYGGLRVGGDDVTLSHVALIDNQAGDDYGGLYVVGSRARLSHITATNNVAYGQYSIGRGAGGIFLNPNYDVVTLTHAWVENNVGLGMDSETNAGGLYLQSGDNSFLQHITVISNSSSYRYAGLYVSGDDVTLDQIEIYSNTAQNEYAGLYLSGDDNYLNDLIVSGNTAGIEHAGVYVTGRRTLLDQLQVEHNQVLTTANCLGGGIHLNSDDSILQNSRISNNRGCYGGGIYLESGPYTLTHNWVTDNYASVDGGGLYLANQGLVKSSYIAGNRADTGGGVYMTSGFGSYYTLANSFIAHNQATTAGGGVYANRNGFLTNNTFVSNQDQAVFYDASSSFGLDATNNIVVSHSIGFESVGDGYIVNDYTLFHGNVDNYSGTVQNGFNNIGGDPAFAYPEQGDYHITQDSAAINAGFAVSWLTDDYDGEPRPNGSAYDIGADESYEKPVQRAYFTYTPSEPLFGQPLRFTGHVLTGTAPITYLWDFGDGSGAEGRYPLHVYPAPGPYTIVMTASNMANEAYHQSIYSETIDVIVRSLLLEPNRVTVTMEGQTVQFWHSLTNTGNVSDSYHLQANSPQGWPVSSTTQVAPLLPGEKATIWVSVTVPWGGDPVGQAIITATSTTAPTVYDTAVDEIIIATSNTQPGVDIAPNRSRAAFAGQTLIYQHVLTNTGDGPDYFRFRTQSSLGWTSTLSPAGGVQINSGHTATLQVRVTIPASASPHQTDVTTITATSLVSPAVSASVIDTSTVLEIIPDVLLEPDYTWVALESGPVPFTHTLTNTGNYSDSFVLTATSSKGWALAWTETPTGPLAAGEAKTVLLTVTVPDGVSGVVDETILTATSQIDGGVYDTATDEIVVPGEQRQPGVALSPGGERSAYAGETIIYQHVLTNTGDGPDRFSLEANSSQAWPLTLTPTSLVISSGQTATVRLSLTLLADAPAGQVDLTTLTATSALSPAVFASAVNTSTVAVIPRGVSLEPDHTIVAMEGDELNFNHVLTNTGIATDSFDLALGASENWPISWTPGPIGPLAADGWALVRVTVTVPSGSAGQINQIVLTATSQADGQTHDTATEVVAVLSDNPQPGVSLTPDRSGVVRPGEVIVYQHTITNTGNGADYFSLQAVSSLGWDLVLTPSLGILLDSGQSDTISLHLMAPADATPGQTDVTTLTATSLLAPAVSASVRDETEVLGEAGYWIYLPIVLKGS